MTYEALKAPVEVCILYVSVASLNYLLGYGMSLCEGKRRAPQVQDRAQLRPGAAVAAESHPQLLPGRRAPALLA